MNKNTTLIIVREVKYYCNNAKALGSNPTPANSRGVGDVVEMKFQNTSKEFHSSIFIPLGWKKPSLGFSRLDSHGGD